MTWFGRGSAAGTGKARRPRARTGLRARFRSRWFRRAAIGLLAVAVIGGSGGYLWFNGHIDRAQTAAAKYLEKTALDAGLGIAKVEIRGVRHASEEAIRRTLGAKTRTLIFNFDPTAARTRLLKSGWIAAATVGRQFPDTIYVDVREREPFALWQYEKKLRLISRDGSVITGEHLGRFTDLPLIVGRDANSHAAEFLDLLAPHADLGARFKSATLVGERRWNLRFDGGIDVRLPEEHPGVALERLAVLQQRHAILDRELRAIDLRLPDRLIVQLLEPPKKSAKDKGKST
ncbi:MAG: FtsQ-type POTRA domain-containing protein [Proteobacteria bacterium]|nr:FtsQ-type POTRA domain-containing protein [Pseudomonadota bacterium]